MPYEHWSLTYIVVTTVCSTIAFHKSSSTFILIIERFHDTNGHLYYSVGTMVKQQGNVMILIFINS